MVSYGYYNGWNSINPDREDILLKVGLNDKSLQNNLELLESIGLIEVIIDIEEDTGLICDRYLVYLPLQLKTLKFYTKHNTKL